MTATETELRGSARGWRRAEWSVHEDDARLQLQIDLGNDLTVVLACWKNGPPEVSLWQAGDNGCRVFEDETVDTFRAWLDEARSRQQ
jgi:hypothetical protein